MYFVPDNQFQQELLLSGEDISIIKIIAIAMNVSLYKDGYLKELFNNENGGYLECMMSLCWILYVCVYFTYVLISVYYFVEDLMQLHRFPSFFGVVWWCDFISMHNMHW